MKNLIKQNVCVMRLGEKVEDMSIQKNGSNNKAKDLVERIIHFMEKKHTEEARKKNKEKHIGVYPTEETREKLSNMRKGEGNNMWGRRGELSPHWGKKTFRRKKR